LIKNYPRGAKELLGAFTHFNSADTVKWFEARGVSLHTEPDGRLFPTTNQSRTVEKCLKDAASKSNVELILGKKIRSIRKSASTFEIAFSSGETHFADKIILATGSSPSGYEMARMLGHTIVDPVPSLFTFEINDARLKGLSGISFESIDATLLPQNKKKYEQSGPMLITHWGLSGPAIIKLSAWGARELYISDYSCNLKINFIPHLKFEACCSMLLERKATAPKKTIKNDLCVDIPRAYWENLIAIHCPNEKITWADVSKKTIQDIASELTQAEFKISGKGKFKEEFVTCGGVSLKEVDFRTMESKICPGLFFAGEILDIDGVTGGFNFQAAWTTGFIAGISTHRTS